MTDRSGGAEGREPSLAEQAAAWVPPWARDPEPAASPPAASPATEDAGAPAPVAEDAADPADPATEQPDAGGANGEGIVGAADTDVVAEDVAADTDVVAEDVAVDTDVVAEDVAVDTDVVAEDVAAESPAAAEPADHGDAAGPGDAAAEPGAAGPDGGDKAATGGEASPEADAAGAEPEGEGGTLGRDGAAATGGGAAEDATAGPSRVPDGEAEPATALALVDEEELRGALEAIMLVVDEPVQDIMLAQVLEQPTERVTAALEAIAEGYTAAGHGFELRRAAGGWRLYTRPRYAPYVERFVLDGQSVRLTQAALETLAVVAYKQPVTRARISAIRGVNCDGVIRTLTSRGLVEECGTEPETGAYLYRTTTLFLEKLGLDSVDQLPDLAPFLPDDVDEVADGER